MLDEPLASPALIADLESRQDEVLRDLDELIARLERVLAPYNPPAGATIVAPVAAAPVATAPAAKAA
jgi:hypothetical protein